jgi:hypothetical protein
MKHLKLFKTQAEFDAATLELPNVNYIVENDTVHFHPYVMDYNSQYLTFEAIEDDLTASLSTNACEYRIDDGSWNNLSAGSNTASINKGQTLSFRGNLTPTSSNGIGTFTISKKCNLKGNIMSLLYGDDFEGQTDLTGKGYAFHTLFYNCANIVDASELILPATVLSGNCYDRMFYGCTSLTTAPELPATTLAAWCYDYMFQGCTSLTSAPSVLPATKLDYYCYDGMFAGCTSLINAPELPATTLANRCYDSMFYGCTSLVNAPELPATKLSYECYKYMFSGCTSLTTAPKLPATTLSDYCYQGMFNSCTSLVTAPELPATTLSNYCYDNMFRGCTSLVNAPELPATTLATRCYSTMFERCTSLTTAPVLPATTLAGNCYLFMFNGCNKLNNIVMLATNISASRCLDGWVCDVASTGTFVKHPNMTSLPSGTSGIPEGWEVKDPITPTECTSLTITADNVMGNETTTVIHYTAICNGMDYKGNTVTGIVKEGTSISAEFPQNTSETETVERTITFEFMGVTASTNITQGIWVDYSKQHLTFKAIEDSTFKLTSTACRYSLDGGKTWNSLSAGKNTPTVPAGNKIMFKVTMNPTISSSKGIGTFSSTGKFNVEGNIMSMLYGDDIADKNDLTGKDSVFRTLFKGCTKVVEAHNLILPATTLASNCYSSMFSGCTSLTTTPELPATTLAYCCYSSMFSGTNVLPDCSNIDFTNEAIVESGGLSCLFSGTKVTDDDLYNILPINMETGNYYLPVTTLAPHCYDTMFYNCKSLTTAPELPATTLADYCYYNMFRGCSSLTTVHTLPATTLAKDCYYSMFYDCTSLTIAPELPANTLADSCYDSMFRGCSKLNYVKMLATDISASNCLYNWVKGVSSTGTFIKHKDMTSLPSGDNGIPTGWTIVDYQ